jgi:ATP-binding cassette subfamily B protein
MPEAPATKKIWDRTAWKDAAFFLRYLKPHYNVFIPALIALAVTAVLSICFVYVLSDLAGKGLSGTKGPGWMTEVQSKIWILVAIVSGQAIIAFFRIMLFAKAAERALAMLRMEIYSRLIRLPMSTLNRHRVGELV